MRTVESYLGGQWVSGEGEGRPIHSAVDNEVIAQASTRGIDLGEAVRYARAGGAALRKLTYAERAELIRQLSEVVVACRDELIDESRANYGATRRDAKFDIDGASGTLSYYAWLGRQLGDSRVLVDGDDQPVLRSKRFVGRHLLVPRRGVAIHINAFNFPCWGMAEKLAVALLAGVPVLSKTATATAPVAELLARRWVEAGVLPEGAFSFLAGSAGDLLDHVGPQDCVAFTGSGEIGRLVRGHPAVLASGARVNIEADSLNASLLGPDVEPGSDTWQMWLNDVVRDFSQKGGQKCTSVRRIFVPEGSADAAIEALVDRLSGMVIGDPAQRTTELGPLAHPGQKKDYDAGVAQLSESATEVWRGEERGSGSYVAPALFRSDDGVGATFVHDHEVFGPAATVLPYDGTAEAAVELVARGGGGLVASLYSDDLDFAREAVLGIAPWHGRILWGSKKIHDQSPGPGTVLPAFVHGGPGKAGGGEELGGERGLRFYLQRTAVQGDRGLLDRMLRDA